MNLNNKTLNPIRRQIGHGLLVTLIGLTTCLTWANQADSSNATDKKNYDVSMSVSINQGKPTVSTLTVTTNEPFILTGGENGLWGGTAVLNSNNNHSVKLAMTLEHAAHVVGHPAIITGNGQTAKIETNDGDSTFTLEFQAKPSQL